MRIGTQCILDALLEKALLLPHRGLKNLQNKVHLMGVFPRELSYSQVSSEYNNVFLDIWNCILPLVHSLPFIAFLLRERKWQRCWDRVYPIRRFF